MGTMVISHQLVNIIFIIYIYSDNEEKEIIKFWNINSL